MSDASSPQSENLHLGNKNILDCWYDNTNYSKVQSLIYFKHFFCATSESAKLTANKSRRNAITK